MLRFSARRLGGANVFMMMMRQCTKAIPAFRGVGGPARAAKLSRTYGRLSPKRFELLEQRAKRYGPTHPRTEKQKPNVTARFVSKNYHKVTGEPSARFRAIAKLYNKQRKVRA
jgi:hypothetical protein